MRSADVLVPPSLLLERDRFDSLFRYHASRVGVDWLLLKAQGIAESNLNPDAVSPVGAKGLAQFMDRTWEEWCDGTPGIQDAPPSIRFNQFDPDDSIRAQAGMMAWLLRRSPTLEVSLAMYNAGYGNVSRARAEVRSIGIDPDDWPAVRTLLPKITTPTKARETTNYVSKIVKTYMDLRRIHG